MCDLSDTNGNFFAQPIIETRKNSFLGPPYYSQSHLEKLRAVKNKFLCVIAFLFLILK